MTPTFARQPLPEERKVLEEWIKNPPSRDHYIRARIILLSADGLSAPDIAQRIGRHESRVRMWIRQFNRFGIEGLQSSRPSESRAEKAEADISEPTGPKVIRLESSPCISERLRYRRNSRAVASSRWAVPPALKPVQEE